MQILPLADEIAEPRPGMNIKVAAFTVSEKSSNIGVGTGGGGGGGGAAPPPPQ